MSRRSRPAQLAFPDRAAPPGQCVTLTLVDLAVIALVGVSVLFALWRGAVREVLSLASWVVAFFAAKIFAPALAGWFAPLSNYENVRLGAAWLAVFFVALIGVSVVAILVSGTLKSIGLGFADRLLGALFGLARGLVIVALLVLASGLTSVPQSAAWQQAVLRPTVEGLGVFARSFLPEALAKYVKFR
jgi:membrane protein required for colicin V production